MERFDLEMLVLERLRTFVLEVYKTSNNPEDKHILDLVDECMEIDEKMNKLDSEIMRRVLEADIDLEEYVVLSDEFLELHNSSTTRLKQLIDYLTDFSSRLDDDLK